MKICLRLLFLVLLSLLSVACATSYDNKNNLNQPGALDLILCEEPRPQVCTQEYNPVCATLRDGSTKTSSTGCSSCSDSEVVGYQMGACDLVFLGSGRAHWPIIDDSGHNGSG